MVVALVVPAAPKIIPHMALVLHGNVNGVIRVYL